MTNLRQVLERAKELRAAQRAYMAHKAKGVQGDPALLLSLNDFREEGERLGKNVAAAANALDNAIFAHDAESKGATRAEVYAAIDSEREYQERLARNVIKQQEPMEHLAVIQKLCALSIDHWYEKSGQLPMDLMRKIAATAVRCMEQHGAPKR